MANDGKRYEELVHMIESSIAPDSIIEHDVNLPILNSTSGATTQCDIVIRSGPASRQTITIVEVQDRATKVKPNDFRGWKQKREDVGAQHLICVSRQEFPASIKEQAQLSGNSIMLVTLKEGVPDDFPNDLIRYKRKSFGLNEITHIQPSSSRSLTESLGVRDDLLALTEFSSNDMCWSLDRVNLISLYQLCRDIYPIPEGVSSGEGELILKHDTGRPLYILINDIFVRIGLELRFAWTNEVIEKPVSILSYEQIDHGVLAWIAEIVDENSKGKTVIRFPLMKKDNVYEINTLYTEIPEGMSLSLGVHRGK